MHLLRHQKGFTLIEIIVGIVVLGFSLTLLTVLIFPQAQRSAEPVMQARASALGQALLDEIISKPFDAASISASSNLRCSEQDAPQCTEPAGFGSGGLTRAEYRSVDDYHDSTLIEDALGTDLADLYRGFSASVLVCYSDATGICYDTSVYPSSSTELYRFKRILVTIVAPTGQEFAFSSVRGNY